MAGWTAGIWPIGNDEYVRDGHIDDLVSAIQELNSAYLPSRDGYIGLIQSMQDELDTIIGPTYTDPVPGAHLDRLWTLTDISATPAPAYADIIWYSVASSPADARYKNIFTDILGVGITDWRHRHPQYVFSEMLNDIRAIVRALKYESFAASPDEDTASANHKEDSVSPLTTYVVDNDVTGVLHGANGDANVDTGHPDYDSNRRTFQRKCSRRGMTYTAYGYLTSANACGAAYTITIRTKSGQMTTGSDATAYNNAVAGTDQATFTLTAQQGLLTTARQDFAATNAEFWHVHIEPIAPNGTSPEGYGYARMCSFAGVGPEGDQAGLFYDYDKDYA